MVNNDKIVDLKSKVKSKKVKPQLKTQNYKQRTFKFSLEVLPFAFLVLSLTCAFAQDLDKAQELFLRGDYKASITECENLLSLNPDKEPLPQVYYLLGLNYLKTGNYLRSRDIFQIIIDEIPKSKLRQEAYLGIADSYFLEGNYSRSKAHYENFIRDFPNSQLLSLAYLRLGQIDLKEGRWKEAGDLFLKIKRDYPLSFEADTAQRLSTGDNFFTVQVASFGDLEKAKALSIKLINKGYPEVFISSLDKEGQTFYRVRMGKFSTQKEALALKDRLTKEGYKPIIYP